jgi:hypothetical protein
MPTLAGSREEVLAKAEVSLVSLAIRLRLPTARRASGTKGHEGLPPWPPPKEFVAKNVPCSGSYSPTPGPRYGATALDLTAATAFLPKTELSTRFGQRRSSFVSMEPSLGTSAP